MLEMANKTLRGFLLVQARESAITGNFKIVEYSTGLNTGADSHKVLRSFRPNEVKKAPNCIKS